MNKFNYTHFSLLEPLDSDIVVSVDFRVKTGTIIGVGSFDDIEMSFNANSGKGVITVSKAIYDTAEFSGITGFNGSLNIAIPLNVEMLTQAYSRSAMGVNDYESIVYSESVTSKAMIGENSPVSVNFDEGLYSEIALAVDVPLELYFTINTQSLFDVETVETYTDTLKVILKPNDELRLDSNNYTLTINGENMLHLYEGDFLQLTRDLIRLNIAVGTSGDIDGKLFFEELWI